MNAASDDEPEGEGGGTVGTPDENVRTERLTEPSPPWTVRNMPRADRDAAVEAAKRADKSMAEWLGEAIRSYIAAERTDAASYEIDAPSDANKSLVRAEGPADPPPAAMQAILPDLVRAMHEAGIIEEATKRAVNLLARRLTKTLAQR